MGAAVGRMNATDADVGRNAEMEYSIIGGDGQDFFEVVTDRHTQEGVVTLRKVSQDTAFLEGQGCANDKAPNQ